MLEVDKVNALRLVYHESNPPKKDKTLSKRFKARKMASFAAESAIPARRKRDADPELPREIARRENHTDDGNDRLATTLLTQTVSSTSDRSPSSAAASTAFTNTLKSSKTEAILSSTSIRSSASLLSSIAAASQSFSPSGPVATASGPAKGMPSLPSVVAVSTIAAVVVLILLAFLIFRRKMITTLTNKRKTDGEYETPGTPSAELFNVYQARTRSADGWSAIWDEKIDQLTPSKSPGGMPHIPPAAVRGSDRSAALEERFRDHTTTDLNPQLLSGSGSTNGICQQPHERQGPIRPVFGAPLAEAVRYCHPRDVDINLPAVVYRCIEYLDARNAESEEGIFRQSGSNVVIQALKERFNTECDINLINDEQYYDVHAVASLLKLYLRELPSNILTSNLHPDFLHVLELCDAQKTVASLNALVHRLPSENLTLLRALLAFLINITNQSESNKMTARNMGIVFSQTLRTPAPILSIFLQDFDGIFGADPDSSTGGKLNEAKRVGPELVTKKLRVLPRLAQSWLQQAR